MPAGGNGTASPATPRKRKNASGEEDGTPTKKRASLKKKVPVEMPDNDIGGSGGSDDLPDDMARFSESKSCPTTQ
jgi:hypothetical protein